jgi:HSP20 family protein
MSGVLFSATKFPLLRINEKPQDREYAMTTQKFDPVREFANLRDTFSRTLGQSVFSVTGGIFPLVDIYETDEEVVVRTAPLDGKLENVEVTMDDDLLMIGGETLPDQDYAEGAYLQRERRFGKFSRALRITRPVKADEARAEFKKGVLTITLPKIKDAETKDDPADE